MKKILIIEDVRFLGVGYSPGDEPVEVADEVADGLIKDKFAVAAEDKQNTDKE